MAISYSIVKEHYYNYLQSKVKPQKILSLTFKPQSQALHLVRCAIEANGGGEGTRTPDPLVANHVLCQLSYTPDEQN